MACCTNNRGRSRQRCNCKQTGNSPRFSLYSQQEFRFQGEEKLLPLAMEHQLDLVNRRTFMRRNRRRAFLLRYVAGIADGATVFVAVDQDGPQRRRHGSGRRAAPVPRRAGRVGDRRGSGSCRGGAFLFERVDRFRTAREKERERVRNAAATCGHDPAETDLMCSHSIRPDRSSSTSSPSSATVPVKPDDDLSSTPNRIKPQPPTLSESETSSHSPS